MTELLYQTDSYLREARGTVAAISPEGGIVLDRVVFYPTGGGQPGDSGELRWNGSAVSVATAATIGDGAVALVPAEPGVLPEIGAEVVQRVDWERRYLHMRMHTALHLLSVVIPLPVTGGSVGMGKGRLDFDMAEPPRGAEEIEARLVELVDSDLPVSEEWITDEELQANPGLVKTMSARPPTGRGRVRLIRIGKDGATVDLQPCGGTHVARTGEVGGVSVAKIEKKGRRNRRVVLRLDAGEAAGG